MIDTGEQVKATSTEKWLSLAAIVLFILFALSRKLDWASFNVLVPTPGSSIIPQDVSISGGAAWQSIGTPLVLCALALIPINLFFMFTENVLDPLAPAIANCVVGAMLVLACSYFVFRTDSILGGSTGKAVQLSYDPATGAYVALGIAALLLATGLAQLRSRFNE